MRAKIKLISYSCAMLMASVLPSHSETLFSKYGMIQNVQNYSLNPTYNPNSPYNNRLPAPVYAMGPSIGTDDCMRIVSDLISIHCSNKNYCANATLSDIRPVIMIQLSRISTGNYATSCGGYIDGEFDKYIASHGGGTQQPRVYLPAHTNTSKAPQIQVKNPYTPQTPDWAIEIQERKQELQDLQSENGTNVYGITQTDFPTTYADMSFSDRMKNEQIGYEPYKNARAYTELKVESLDSYQNRFANSTKGKTLAKLKTDAEAIIAEYKTLYQKINDLKVQIQGIDSDSQEITQAKSLLETAESNLDAAKNSANEVLDTLTRQVQTSEISGLTNSITDAQNKIDNVDDLIEKVESLITIDQSNEAELEEEAGKYLNAAQSIYQGIIDTTVPANCNRATAHKNTATTKIEEITTVRAELDTAKNTENNKRQAAVVWEKAKQVYEDAEDLNTNFGTEIRQCQDAEAAARAAEEWKYKYDNQQPTYTVSGYEKPDFNFCNYLIAFRNDYYGYVQEGNSFSLMNAGSTRLWPDRCSNSTDPFHNSAIMNQKLNELFGSDEWGLTTSGEGNTYGILYTDDTLSSHTACWNSGEEALSIALSIRNVLKSTVCNELHMYVIEKPDRPNYGKLPYMGSAKVKYGPIKID